MANPLQQTAYVPLGEYAKLERVAIRKSYRGKNLGHKLTDFMMSVAKEQGFKKYKVHAQVYLAEFYRKHGFEIVGDMFKEAGIDHYLMIRDDNPVKIYPAKAL